MGGSGDNDLEKEDKIIRKIAKNVLIDKTIEPIYSYVCGENIITDIIEKQKISN